MLPRKSMRAFLKCTSLEAFVVGAALRRQTQLREDGGAHGTSVLLVMSNARSDKNVVLSSGLVSRSAICSLVGTQFGQM